MGMSNVLTSGKLFNFVISLLDRHMLLCVICARVKKIAAF